MPIKNRGGLTGAMEDGVFARTPRHHLANIGGASEFGSTFYQAAVMTASEQQRATR
ncbi:hypothetical protein [Bythopirellula goksoeyrii]|uniref:hypothetical protein n=1 Tax=Bythopirellula goksoeyrii TaxID=1400387 RepID=UPI00143DF529|nr:hypothetical protein [Bythopirellula goksoeyrii]